MASWRAAAVKGVNELRFAFCQTAPASEGVRAFITQHYAALKGANPSLPILVRECAGADAKLTARFAKGREEAVSLAGLGPDGVAASLDALLKKA